MVCGTCLSHPPPFTRTYALFPYQAPLPHIITRLKFHHQLAYAQALGELMAERIQTSWYANQPLPDLIIPIPLHPARMRERGFNQAVEIARTISKQLGIPIDYSGCKRIRHTAQQSGLTAKGRQRNITAAFSIERDYSGLSVAVIDDVITTGQTIREFCRLLRAKQVDIWCCARA